MIATKRIVQDEGAARKTAVLLHQYIGSEFPTYAHLRAAIGIVKHARHSMTGEALTQWLHANAKTEYEKQVEVFGLEN